MNYLYWMVVSVVLVQADIGGVHVGIQLQLQQCLSLHTTIQESLGEQLQCLKLSTYRCLLFREPLGARHTEIRQYCGVINIGQQVQPYLWHIQVLSRFGLLIDFLHFYLPSTLTCSKAVLIEAKHPYSKLSFLTYCGHRKPWSVGFLSSHIIVKCTRWTPKGYYFVMIFEAVDFYLHSVALEQRITHSILNFNRPHFKDVLQVSTFALLSRNKKHPFPQTTIHVQIMTRVYKRIIVQVSFSSLNKTDIFNGPGPLSPKVTPEQASNCCQVQLSSYQAYIRYHTTTLGDIVEAYNKANMESFIETSLLNWTSIYHEGNSVDCLHQGTKTYFKSTSGQCWPRHHVSSFTLHHISFTGFNMLQHSATGYTTTCEYGGLFIMHYTTGSYSDYISICSNTTSQHVFPYSFPYSLGNDARADIRMVIILVTFPGYSRGFADLTAITEENCIGVNYIDGFVHTQRLMADKWWDPMNNNHGEVISCTDFWITHNALYTFHDDLVNKQYYLYYIQDIDFMMALNKMIISSSLLSRTTFHNSEIMKNDIEMGVWTIEYSGYPIQLYIDRRFHPLMLQSTHYINIRNARNIEIDFQYSGHDEEPLFALRIQFLHNIICSFPVDKSSGIPIPMYELRDIVDVHIPTEYHYGDVLLRALNYSWHNVHPCRMVLIGQLCSPLKSQYQRMRINYRATRFVDAHEIDISLKQTLSCSVQCSLDVGIWVIAMFEPPNRYHEWKEVYRLTWHIVDTDLSSFIIEINSTCVGSPCTKLCDIAVAFRPFKSWINEEIFPEMKISFDAWSAPFKHMIHQSTEALLKEKFYWGGIHGLEVDRLMYVTWYEAQEHCKARNASLATLTPNLVSQLNSFGKHFMGNSWKDSSCSLHHMFFAGLHRNDMVRTNAY